MTFLLLGIIAGVALPTFIYKKDFFHPSRIYVFVYALLFAVYSLHLCRFQNPWSSTTYMLYWGGVIMLLGSGAIVSYYVKHCSGRYHEIASLASVKNRLADKESSVNWNWFFAVTVAVFVFFLSGYIYNFIRTGIIPIFAENPDQHRLSYLTGGYFNVLSGAAGTIVMMLCAELLLVNKVSRKYKVAAFIMLLLAGILYFTFVTRMPLVRTFLYIAVLAHYLRKQLSFSSVLIIFSLILVFFLVGAFIRTDVEEFTKLAARLRINVPIQFLPFTNPYAYAVNNIWNMDHAFRQFVDGANAYNFSLGFEFFRGLFFFTPFEMILQGTYGFDTLFNNSIIKVKGLNTVVYIWHFYKDFGLAGVFGLSFVLGFIVHLFYYNTLLVPSHLRIAALGLLTSMIVFSIMIPLWSFWNIYFEAAILLAAHRAIKTV